MTDEEIDKLAEAIANKLKPDNPPLTEEHFPNNWAKPSSLPGELQASTGEKEIHGHNHQEEQVGTEFRATQDSDV